MPTPTHPSDASQPSPAVPADATPRDAIESALSGASEAASDGFETLESVTAQDLHVGDVLRVEACGNVYEFEVFGFSKGLVIMNLNISIQNTPFIEGEAFIWFPTGRVVGSAFHAEQFGQRPIAKKSLEVSPVSGMKIKRAKTD